jgi:hypothetical protein
MCTEITGSDSRAEASKTFLIKIHTMLKNLPEISIRSGLLSIGIGKKSRFNA